jgi:hypothetical protein
MNGFRPEKKFRLPKSFGGLRCWPHGMKTGFNQVETEFAKMLASVTITP